MNNIKCYNHNFEFKLRTLKLIDYELDTNLRDLVKSSMNSEIDRMKLFYVLEKTNNEELTFDEFMDDDRNLLLVYNNKLYEDVIDMIDSGLKQKEEFKEAPQTSSKKVLNNLISGDDRKKLMDIKTILLCLMNIALIAIFMKI